MFKRIFMVLAALAALGAATGPHAPKSEATPTVALPTVKPTDPRHKDYDLNKTVFLENAKAAVTALLHDPDSARFRNVVMPQPMVACGDVNGKNALGGYGGHVRFVVIVEQPLVDDGGRDFRVIWNSLCAGKRQ
jgi:hypothetical protein